MPRKSAIQTIVLGLAAAGMFLVECAQFHFPFATGLDIFCLSALTILPGVLVVLWLQQFFSLNLASHEILSLGGAVGFGMVPVFLGVMHSVGIGLMGPMRPIGSGIIIGILIILLVSRQKFPLRLSGLRYATKELLVFAIGTLLLFALYNFQQFHYAADGSIATRGLFGVDLPFLAGEVHGLRDFGSLHDLHQMAQPWHYHDWTYQLLTLLPRERTLPDLAFAAPFVGYIMLALSIFTLSLQLTSSKYIAYVSVALWFLVSGLEGGELSSYALSPSFVFGSVLFLNVLLALDLRLKATDRKKQWVFSAVLLFLLIELSQTKLSSFLVLMGGMDLLGLMLLRKQRNSAIEILIVSIAALGILLWQNAGANPLMPSGDFLIGAPLLGYANHVAAILHVPVSAINPVSHGLSFQWQSLLIIPFFIIHFLRFAFFDPKILSAILLIIFFRTLLWRESKEIVWLLLLLIPLGFLLPVLYSPAWYPLALSFYAPLVSVQSSVMLTTIAFGILAKEQNTPRNHSRMLRATLGIIGLMYLAGIAMNVGNIFRDDTAKANVVNAPLAHAMNYLSTHTSDSAIIATRRFDFDSSGDESYYWYAALSGRTVISEGAKYGSLLAAYADTNTEKGLHRVAFAEQLLDTRRVLLDTIFGSHDSEHVFNAIREARANYLLETGSQHLSIDPNSFAELMFTEGDYKIWRVR